MDSQTCNSDVVSSKFIQDDLQLAAELGKTLLERAKELELLLAEEKTKNEEKQREILHLRKQINAMTEVNDTRLKVYDQLEVGIQELERSNHRLTLEKTRDKKQIKSFSATIESLETRCEELSQLLEETKHSLSLERRKNNKPAQQHPQNTVASKTGQLSLPEPWIGLNRDKADLNATTSLDNSSFTAKANSTGLNDISLSQSNDKSLIISKAGNSSQELPEAAASCAIKGDEELIGLISDMENIKRDYVAEKQRCCELEDQLVAIIQENQDLQGRVALTSTNEDMMSMHDEFSLLDDVRQGQMCSRCLRVMEEHEQTSNNDGQSSIAQTEDMRDDDERSLLGSELSANFPLKKPLQTTIPNADANTKMLADNPNVYRDLIEKYEALLEMQRNSLVLKTNVVIDNNLQQLAKSLKPDPSQSGNEACLITNKSSKTVRGRTSAEYSEAETSSSGFSEEISNKYTQTDERPGYFLCSISNGEECKLSIYDDVSPIDSHFHSRPEYRELFKEIFGILKKAADSKENVQDHDPNSSQPTNDVMTGRDAHGVDEFSVDFGDDTQSIISSVMSNESFAISECVTKLERKTAKKHINECKNQENRILQASSIFASTAHINGTERTDEIRSIEENSRVLTPLKREPLEYLSIGVGIKKKNRNRRNRSQHNNGVRVESPLAQRTPTHHVRRTRRDFAPIPPDMLGTEFVARRGKERSNTEWDGSPMIIYNRTISSSGVKRTSRVFELNGVEFHPNTVSQEFHKLKRLDLSYAEVLRRSDAYEHQHQNQSIRGQQRTQPPRWNANKQSQNSRR
ncbi:Cen [Drosophila busckii]|uniref:Cen n=1 Tax=Drosophila busckii TaxID=30019 RepID=A0A0M3QXI0_DROBS|nr:cerebellar degeneration-related protein 2-like [Drosophila busckii]ALC45909.1 Cen [Drosophila busckii]